MLDVSVVVYPKVPDLEVLISIYCGFRIENQHSGVSKRRILTFLREKRFGRTVFAYTRNASLSVTFHLLKGLIDAIFPTLRERSYAYSDKRKPRSVLRWRFVLFGGDFA